MYVHTLFAHFREAYAKKFLTKSFDHVIFSDEKLFRFRAGMSVGVWRPKGSDRLSAKYSVKTTQRGEGVMVWAAINSKGEYILRRCVKKIKAQDYQDMLSDCLPFIRSGRWLHVTLISLLRWHDVFHRSTRTKVHYMQDGAPIHKANSATRWFRLKGVKLFNDGHWPPQSPDLNIIEHVWPRVASAMKGQVYRNADELWQAIEKAFATEVTPALVQNLYKSIPKRLFACLGAKGGHTKY